MNILSMNLELAEMLEAGDIPWTRKTFRAKSSINNIHEYTGYNALKLSGIEDTYFLTASMAKNAGLWINDINTDFTVITYPKMYPKKDENGKQVMGVDGKPMMAFSHFLTTKVYGVSRVREQEKVQGIIAEQLKKQGIDFGQVQDAETYLEQFSGIEIVKPAMTDYQNSNEYYNDIVKRYIRAYLNMDAKGKDEKEVKVSELALEIASGYICNTIGVEVVIKDIAQYCSYWVGEYNENKYLLTAGAKKAFQIVKEMKKVGK